MSKLPTKLYIPKHTPVSLWMRCGTTLTSNGIKMDTKHQRAVYECPLPPALLANTTLATFNAFQQMASQRLRLHTAHVQATPAVPHKCQQLNSRHCLSLCTAA